MILTVLLENLTININPYPLSFCLTLYHELDRTSGINSKLDAFSRRTSSWPDFRQKWVGINIWWMFFQKYGLTQKSGLACFGLESPDMIQFVFFSCCWNWDFLYSKFHSGDIDKRQHKIRTRVKLSETASFLSRFCPTGQIDNGLLFFRKILTESDQLIKSSEAKSGETCTWQKIRTADRHRTGSFGLKRDQDMIRTVLSADVCWPG